MQPRCELFQLWVLNDLSQSVPKSGHCFLEWSHQYIPKNLTWNDGTTEHEWGNMGLWTQLTVILWLQDEQALGWGQHCRWRSSEGEGLWDRYDALEHLNQPATWPALPLNCPLWASEPLYWKLFELISVSHRKYILLPFYTLFAKLSHLTCGLCPSLPGGWMPSP